MIEPIPQTRATFRPCGASATCSSPTTIPRLPLPGHESVTLYPRSLFGRLALLLLAVVAIALAATIMVFRHDRAALIERAFGDTKIAQLQAVRAALESSDAAQRRETVRRIGREFDVRIIPENERPLLGAGAPVMPQVQDLEACPGATRARNAGAGSPRPRSAVRARAGERRWILDRLSAPSTTEGCRRALAADHLEFDACSCPVSCGVRICPLPCSAIARAQRRGRARRTRRVTAAVARERSLGDRKPESHCQRNGREPASARAGSRVAACRSLA